MYSVGTGFLCIDKSVRWKEERSRNDSGYCTKEI